MADKYFGGIKAGSTSVSINVQLRNITDNMGTTGKVAANFTLATQRANTASATQAASDLAAITTAWAAGGVKEVDAVNFPGVYRVDFPDAAFASGVDFVELGVVCAGTYGWTLMVPLSSDVIQTGDSFGRIGAAGAGLTAVGDTPGTTTLLGRITAAVMLAASYVAPDNADIVTALADLVTLLARVSGNVALNVDIQTLLTRVPALVPVATDYTAARAAKLDDLDATISSRSTYAGTDTPGTTQLLTNVAALPQAPLGFKKNTLFPAFTFPMFNPTDHLTPKTGLTVTATRLIDGAAAFAACANAVVEVGATGYYRFDIAAADLNGNDITFNFTAPGGDPLTFSVKTVP